MPWSEVFHSTLQKWIFYAFWYRFFSPLPTPLRLSLLNLYWNSGCISQVLWCCLRLLSSPQILHHHYRYRPCFAFMKNILFEIIANRYSMMFFFSLFLESNMLLILLTFFLFQKRDFFMCTWMIKFFFFTNSHPLYCIQ